MFFALMLLVLMADKDPFGSNEDWDAAYLGLVTVNSDAIKDAIDKKDYLNDPKADGPIVVFVAPHSPAASSKLQFLDQITAVDGKRCRTTKELVELLENRKPGDTLVFSVNRIHKARKKAGWTNKEKVSVTLLTRKAGAIAAVKIDDVDANPVCQHKSAPKSVASGSSVDLYFRIIDGKPGPLFIRVQYLADDWLFIRECTIKSGDDRFTIKATDVSRDNGRGQIWEWFDHPATANDVRAITAAATGSDSMIRCTGKDYFKDRQFEESEKSRMIQMIRAYRAMGGTLVE